MADLTDKEIVAACARAMGLLPYMNPPELTQHGMVVERLISGGVHSSSQQFFYNPLTDRAQAMELLIALRIEPWWDGDECIAEMDQGRKAVRDADPIRAICLCAARVQIEKEKNA